MKILIFEYVTGGGFNKQILPDHLKQEGSLMLRALLDNFLTIPSVDLLVMLDYRLTEIKDQYRYDTAVVDAHQDCIDVFTHLVQQCDAVWPIAPEFDDILYTLCRIVETTEKQLLCSSSSVIQLTGNKYLTYQHLQKHHIATVPTCLLTDHNILADALPALTEACGPASTDGWIIKPTDGVGCMNSRIIHSAQDLTHLDSAHYIIQPHLQGQKTSLSCLFKEGAGWIIAVNLQQFALQEQRYQLTGIIVNNSPHHSDYQHLVHQIALACPELWGYIGIDLIETPDQTWVLEINPRLTTAFVGIQEALSINIADAILQLQTRQPNLQPRSNQSVTITINQDHCVSI